MAWSDGSTDTNPIYYSGTESLTVPDSAGTNVVSIGSTILTADISGVKFPVYVAVTEASTGNGHLDVALQCSHDGTVWLDADASLDMDVDSTSTSSVASGLADATNIVAPYWRFLVSTDGLVDTQDTSTVSLSYAALDIKKR